jgi:Uma2 family endonuclease
MPLAISAESEPEPDLAIVSGEPRDHRGQDHPRSALLLVEVSDQTLRFDTGPKASLYASAGIPDYWVIDLLNRRVILHRTPAPDASQPFGFTYGNISRVERNGFVSPLALPDKRIAVADLLP